MASLVTGGKIIDVINCAGRCLIVNHFILIWLRMSIVFCMTYKWRSTFAFQYWMSRITKSILHPHIWVAVNLYNELILFTMLQVVYTVHSTMNIYKMYPEITFLTFLLNFSHIHVSSIWKSHYKYAKAFLLLRNSIAYLSSISSFMTSCITQYLEKFKSHCR